MIGYRGDFRRWSLHPGRYIHRIVPADLFSIRVKRNNIIHSQVLSILPFDNKSCLSSWQDIESTNSPSLNPASVTYKALFPR